MSQNNQRKRRNQPNNVPQPSSSSTPYQKNQPFWKGTIIQLLKGTIGILENTVVKLETEQPTNTVKKLNFVELLFLRWDKFLQTFRLFLPSKVSNNVSDGVLTLILGVFLISVIATGTLLIIPKSTQIATLPPVEEVIKTTPEPIPEPETTLELIPEPETTPEPIPEPETTPEPIPEPETTLEQKPTPFVELTPEQSLIATIENQLAEIAVISIKNQEDEKININLIKSIQANLQTSDLIITINEDWYKLEKTAQQKIAAKILQRSQELDFTHLQIINSQEQLIARSPVVGEEMIFFKSNFRNN